MGCPAFEAAIAVLWDILPGDVGISGGQVPSVALHRVHQHMPPLYDGPRGEWMPWHCSPAGSGVG